jgi:hypothetical protein
MANGKEQPSKMRSLLANVTDAALNASARRGPTLREGTAQPLMLNTCHGIRSAHLAIAERMDLFEREGAIQ